MFDFFTLTKRNVLVFVRDKASVFYSMISSVIMLVLYFAFIGSLVAKGFSEGSGLSTDIINYLSYSQMLGGVIVVNTVSLALGAFSVMVKDRESDTLASFLATPVNRTKLVASYYLTSFIVASVFNTILWLLGVLYVGLRTGFWYPIGTIIAVIGCVFLFTAITAGMVVLISSLVKKMSMFSAISGTLGTFVAFLSGIYIPFNTMGKTIENIGSLQPFTHMAIWLKQIILKDALNQSEVTNLPIEAQELIKSVVGANNLGIMGANVPLSVMLIIGAIIGALCFGATAIILNRRYIK